MVDLLVQCGGVLLKTADAFGQVATVLAQHRQPGADRGLASGP